MKETWKLVPGYVDLEASDLGRVRKASSGKIKAMAPGSHGYRHTGTTEASGRTGKTMIHKLVMLAFVGTCPDGLEVDHDDRDKLNNKLSNLSYKTRSEQHRNKGSNVLVQHKCKQVLLIEALEDMFGADCVSSKRSGQGYKTYMRIKNNTANGWLFTDAVAYEIAKHGTPEGKA